MPQPRMDIPMIKVILRLKHSGGFSQEAIARSPVGWSGNSNICVQMSGHAKTCHRECGVPLEFTLFTPTYRAWRPWGRQIAAVTTAGAKRIGTLGKRCPVTLSDRPAALIQRGC